MLYFVVASVVIVSIVPRRTTHCCHVMRFLHPGWFYGTKIPSPQLLLFPALINRDTRNPIGFRSYENYRVYTDNSHFGTSSLATNHWPLYSNPFFSYPCALFCIFLHSRKTQLLSFQPLPHSLPKTTRGGGTPHSRREPK